MNIILIAILIFLFVVFVVVRFYNPQYFFNFTRKKNCIIYGPIGSGKDLAMAILTHKEKKEHIANIPYNKKTIVKPLNYVTVSPNTYVEFIDDNITIIEKSIQEGKNIYISDGGVYLPSQMDTVLSKKYPSFPIAYALIRHLANANIYVNVQNLNRLWIKLREQADGYVRTRGAFFFPKWLPFLRRYFLLKITLYENYEDALERLRPIKKMLTGDSTAVARSERGLIKEMRLLVPKRWLKYDTRYFHKVIYGVEAPSS
jgi:hypothetical protein